MLAKMLAKMLGLSTQMVAGDKNHQKGKKAKKNKKKKRNSPPSVAKGVPIRLETR